MYCSYYPWNDITNSNGYSPTRPYPIYEPERIKRAILMPDRSIQIIELPTYQGESGYPRVIQIIPPGR
jgi:hypothetical protein